MIPHHRQDRKPGKRQDLGSGFRLDQAPAIGDIAGHDQQVCCFIQPGKRLDQFGRRCSLDVQITNCGDTNHATSTRKSRYPSILSHRPWLTSQSWWS